MKSSPKPIATVGGTVDKSCLSLRIFGDDVNPLEITKLLGHKPSVGRKKGQKYRVRGSKEYVARTGSWSLKAPESKKANVNEQAEWLLSRLSKDIATWQKITSQHRVDLFCGLFLNSWNRGMSLSPEMLLEIGRRGILLSLDIYADYPREEMDWVKKLEKE